MPGAAPSAKGGPVQEIVYEDPGAFRFSVEAGYASQHLWRGIDLVQLTSFNHQAPGAIDKADSDVTFLAANASYQGFGFGLKYIRSIDDNLNPFFAPLLSDTDSYEELVLSLNYTHGFLDNGALTTTFGFDFFYYPNGEFWGVDHQGLLYARASYAAHQWANPFVELFYNVPTTSSGNGLAINSTFRGASGSDLVEGYGAEIGVSGGDNLYVDDTVAVGLTYSTSVFYKQGYAFEDDGFSHLMLTLGVPVVIGGNVTITPSVTYSYALQDVSKPAGAIPGYYSRSSAWNEPGFSAGVRLSWQF